MRRILVVGLVLILGTFALAAPPKKGAKSIKKDLKSMQWMALLRTPTLVGNGPTIRKNKMDGYEEYEVSNGAVMVTLDELPPVSKTSFVWSHESGFEEVQTIVLRSDGEFANGAPETGLAISFHVKTGVVKVTEYVKGKLPVVTAEWKVWQGGIPRGARHNWFPIQIWDLNGEIDFLVNNNVDNPSSILKFTAKYDRERFPDSRLMVFNEERRDPMDYRCFFRDFQFQEATPDQFRKQLSVLALKN